MINAIKRAELDQPILDLLAACYSPYVFNGQPVEAAKLLLAREAARWAASSFNEQPWRYILAERSDEAAFSNALDCLVEANQSWAKHAGALLPVNLSFRAAGGSRLLKH